jgi:glycosyltransferase involved in cell wall biosynthesis
MTVPRVTIGVPVYNGERFLSHTLDALLSQSFKDFEVVVCDNASTDRTEEIGRAYAARDSRIRYFRNEVNIGAAPNHNRVFELARGEFFKWNSADDYCGPEFLERCVAALDEDPTAAQAVSQPAEVDEEGVPLKAITVWDQTLIPAVPDGAPAHIRFRQNIRLDHLCLTIYSLFRSSLLRQSDLIASFADSDRVLLAHMSLCGPCVVIPETLLFNRDHAGRFSRSYNRYYDGWRDRAAWFDPLNANRMVFPFWRETLELLKVVHRSPVKWPERGRCYWEVVRWLGYKGHMRRLYVDATHYPRKWIVRNFPGAKSFWNSIWGKRPAVAHSTDMSVAPEVNSQSASLPKH